jgi:hypothetical protein
MDRSDPGQARRARQALDVLMYAVVWVATLVAVSAVVSFPLGGGWVGVKYVLFFVGFFLFGLSALRLRPTPPWKDDRETSGEREETRFQAFVQRLPPLGRYGLAPDERLSAATKLFIASVLSLVFSYLLETVFGIKA